MRVCVQTELGTGGVALRQRERVQTELGMGEVGQDREERMCRQNWVRGEVGQTQREGV